MLHTNDYYIYITNDYFREDKYISVFKHIILLYKKN